VEYCSFSRKVYPRKWKIRHYANPMYDFSFIPACICAWVLEGRTMQA
jgi:hypothetical protein